MIQSKIYIKINLIFTFIFSLILYGCTQQNENIISLKNIKEKNVPVKAINDVVLINQNDNYSCATTSLGMILSEYEGKHNNPLDKDLIWNYSGSSKSVVTTCGNDLEGLYKVCDKFGYKYELIQNLSNLEVEYLLSKGIYLVAFVRVDEYRTHAIVITGYDRFERLFYINDPSYTKIFIPYSILDSKWNSGLIHPTINTVRAALVVIPKNYLISNKGLRG